MSDFLSIRAISLATPPAASHVSLDAYLKRPTGTAPPANVLDTISLSAEAQAFIATTGTAFPNRTVGLSELAKGTTSFGVRDYSGAAFIGQDLRGAVFQGSILENVNFTGANLQGAKFIDALVTGAIFGQTDLRGADLSRAQDLQFAQVARAIFDTTTILPIRIGNAIFGTFSATGGAISSARG